MTNDPTKAGGDPQAGDPPAPQPQAGNLTPPQAGSSQPPSKSAEEYERIIADLRKENADRRTKLKTFEDAEAARQQANLSETERLQKQYADAQVRESELSRQLQEMRINNAVLAQASSLNIVDPDAASKLLDWSQITYDENGQPTNIDRLLKDLIKSRTWLVGSQQRPAPTSGGATNPPRSQTNAEALSWEAISKMTAEEYAARRPEIQRFMEAHPAQMGRRLR